MYNEFDTLVKQAELGSMDKLGLRVPYLERWTEDLCDSNVVADSFMDANIEPVHKRLRVQGPEVKGAPGSALDAKQRQYAALQEALACERLDIEIAKLAIERAVLAQERATMAQETANFDAEQQRQAVNASTLATRTTAAAATDIPDMQVLNPSSALPSGPTGKQVTSQQPFSELPAAKGQPHSKTGTKLFKGNSIAAIWKEWQYGGDYDSVCCMRVRTTADRPWKW